MENEKIQVDIHNAEVQRKEAIIKTGRYVKLEICVGLDNLPTCNLDVSRISTEQIATLLSTMEIMKKQILKMDPIAGVKSQIIGIKTNTFITKKDEENNKNKMEEN